MRWRGKASGPAWWWRCDTCGHMVQWKQVHTRESVFYGCPTAPKCWGNMEMISPLEELMRDG